MRTGLGIALAMALAACSNSNPPLTGPGVPCTSYAVNTEIAGPLPDASGLVGDVAPWCVPFNAGEVDAGQLTCSLYVTLDAPGDESVCESLGLLVPDADDLGQIRAGNVANGAADRSADPTCLVPQLGGMDLDDAGSCFSSSGWCLMSSWGGCSLAVLFSPEKLQLMNGTLVTLGCALCGD
jgi:hypothetical protein